MSIEQRFWAKVNKTDGCWEWTAARQKGPRGCPSYGCFSVGSRRDQSKRMVAAHRVAWQLAEGTIPDGLNVLHRCDNVLCVRPDHLFLGTQADNVADMISKGRKVPAVGERQWNARLTTEQVLQIRSEYRKGTSPKNPGNGRELAAKFGVKRGTITDVANRAWRSV